MRCGGVNLRCSRLYHRRPVHLCRRPIHNGRLWLPWATITYPVKLLGQQPSKINGKKIAVFPASITSSNNLPSKLNSQSFKIFGIRLSFMPDAELEINSTYLHRTSTSVRPIRSRRVAATAVSIWSKLRGTHRPADADRSTLTADNGELLKPT